VSVPIKQGASLYSLFPVLCKQKPREYGYTQNQDMLLLLRVLRSAFKRKSRLAGWHQAHQSRHNPAVGPLMESLVSETNFFCFPLEDLTRNRHISLSVSLAHPMLTSSHMGVQNVSDCVRLFFTLSHETERPEYREIQQTLANPVTVNLVVG
jgi:hypothetical protein